MCVSFKKYIKYFVWILLFHLGCSQSSELIPSSKQESSYLKNSPGECSREFNETYGVLPEIVFWKGVSEDADFKIEDFTKAIPFGVKESFDEASCVHHLYWASTSRMKTLASGELIKEVDRRDQARARDGIQSLKISLFPGANMSGGWRSEIRDKNHALPGSEVWYALSTFIPKTTQVDGKKQENFPYFDPRPQFFEKELAEKDLRPNYYIFHQFHDQKMSPLERDRESSPPLALRYKRGKLYFTVMNSFIYQNYKKSKSDGDGEVIWTSEKLEKKLGAGRLKERWLDFIYHIKWPHAKPVSGEMRNCEKNESCPEIVKNFSEPGFLKIWVDYRKNKSKGSPEYKLIVDCTGVVGFFDRLGVYLKYGVYAKRDVYSPRVAYHDRYVRAVVPSLETKEKFGVHPENSFLDEISSLFEAQGLPLKVISEDEKRQLLDSPMGFICKTLPE